MYSFITDGNFVIFKETDDVPFVYTEGQSSFYEKEVFKLHNTSKCVDWGLTEDTTRITFTIDEERYENILLSSIDFDGDVCTTQQDFIDGVQGMFENLAGGGGGSSYLVYTSYITQHTSNNANITATVFENTIGTVTWSRQGQGQYRLSSAGLFTSGKTFLPQFGFSPTNYGAGIGCFGFSQIAPQSFMQADYVNSSTIDFYFFINTNGQSQAADIYSQIEPGNIPLEIRVYP